MRKAKVRSHWNERWQKVETPYPTVVCDYYISDYGRIKSVNKENEEERLLNGSKGNSGTRTLNIRLEDKHRMGVYIHRFVAEHFVEETPEDIELDRKFIDHINGDKSNNHYKNLRRVNRDELTVIQKERGIISIERIKKALTVKMTETKVRLLKKRLKQGKTKKKILARNFNITPMQVWRIETGENWSHVTIDEKKDNQSKL